MAVVNSRCHTASLVKIMNQSLNVFLISSVRLVALQHRQIKREFLPPRYGLIDSCCGQSSPHSHVALSRSLADN